MRERFQIRAIWSCPEADWPAFLAAYGSEAGAAQTHRDYLARIEELGTAQGGVPVFAVELPLAEMEQRVAALGLSMEETSWARVAADEAARHAKAGCAVGVKISSPKPQQAVASAWLPCVMIDEPHIRRLGLAPVGAM